MFSVVYVSQSLCLQMNASHMTTTLDYIGQSQVTWDIQPWPWLPAIMGPPTCSYVNTLVHSRLADMFLFVISLYRHTPPALPPHHGWKVDGWYSTKMPSC